MSISDDDKELLASAAATAGAPVTAAALVAHSAGDPVVTATVLAGPALAGLLQVGIGRLFKSRGEKCINQLVARLDALEDESGKVRAKKRLDSEEGQDLALQAYLLAGTSSGQDRVAQIVEVVTNGLTAEQMNHAYTKKIMSLLSELDEAEIVILQYFLPGNRYNQEFFSKHHHVLQHSRSPYDVIENKRSARKDYRPSEEEYAEAKQALPQHILFRSRRDHLIALGLVGPEDSDISPELTITGIGALLLSEIGSVSNDIYARGIPVNVASVYIKMREKDVQTRRSLRGY